MQAGKKYDEGKPMLATFYKDFSNAFKALVAVAEYGRKKYSEQQADTNWREVPDALPRYKDALFRHLDKYLTGEAIDPESKHLHLAHIIWNACALYELEKDKITLRDIAGL